MTLAWSDGSLLGRLHGSVDVGFGSCGGCRAISAFIRVDKVESCLTLGLELETVLVTKASYGDGPPQTQWSVVRRVMSLSVGRSPTRAGRA